MATKGVRQWKINVIVAYIMWFATITVLVGEIADTISHQEQAMLSNITRVSMKQEKLTINV